jgi:hypothetical protein
MTERDERDERDIFQEHGLRGADRRKAGRRKVDVIKLMLKYFFVAIVSAILLKLMMS